MFAETTVLKVSENSLKNVFKRVLFKALRVVQSATNNYTETDLTAYVSCELSESF